MTLWRGAALTLALLAAGQKANGQSADFVPRRASSDTLFFGGQLVDLSTGSRGGTGEIDWLRVLSPRQSLNVGASSFSLAGTQWAYGRLGTTLKPASRTTLHAETELGRGREAGKGFGYKSLRGSLAYEVLEKRLVFEIEDRYLQIQQISGNVLKIGASFLPSASLSVTAAAHGTTSGNVDTRVLVLRVDREGKAFSAFAGVSAGRSRPVLVELAATGPAQGLRQAFGGVGIPVGRLRLIMALDWLDLGEVRRGSLMMSWKLPL